jgi:hypothetical protein
MLNVIYPPVGTQSISARVVFDRNPQAVPSDCIGFRVCDSMSKPAIVESGKQDLEYSGVFGGGDAGYCRARGTFRVTRQGYDVCAGRDQ